MLGAAVPGSLSPPLPLLGDHAFPLLGASTHGAPAPRWDGGMRGGSSSFASGGHVPAGSVHSSPAAYYFPGMSAGDCSAVVPAGPPFGHGLNVPDASSMVPSMMHPSMLGLGAGGLPPSATGPGFAAADVAAIVPYGSGSLAGSDPRSSHLSRWGIGGDAQMGTANPAFSAAVEYQLQHAADELMNMEADQSNLLDQLGDLRDALADAAHAGETTDLVKFSPRRGRSARSTSVGQRRAGVQPAQPDVVRHRRARSGRPCGTGTLSDRVRGHSDLPPVEVLVESAGSTTDPSRGVLSQVNSARSLRECPSSNTVQLGLEKTRRAQIWAALQQQAVHDTPIGHQMFARPPAASNCAASADACGGGRMLAHDWSVGQCASSPMSTNNLHSPLSGYGAPWAAAPDLSPGESAAALQSVKSSLPFADASPMADRLQQLRAARAQAKQEVSARLRNFIADVEAQEKPPGQSAAVSDTPATSSTQLAHAVTENADQVPQQRRLSNQPPPKEQTQNDELESLRLQLARAEARADEEKRLRQEVLANPQQIAANAVANANACDASPGLVADKDSVAVRRSSTIRSGGAEPPAEQSPARPRPSLVRVVREDDCGDDSLATRRPSVLPGEEACGARGCLVVPSAARSSIVASDIVRTSRCPSVRGSIVVTDTDEVKLLKEELTQAKLELAMGRRTSLRVATPPQVLGSRRSSAADVKADAEKLKTFLEDEVSRAAATKNAADAVSQLELAAAEAAVEAENAAWRDALEARESERAALELQSQTEQRLEEAEDKLCELEGILEMPQRSAYKEIRNLQVKVQQSDMKLANELKACGSRMEHVRNESQALLNQNLMQLEQAKFEVDVERATKDTLQAKVDYLEQQQQELTNEQRQAEDKLCRCFREAEEKLNDSLQTTEERLHALEAALADKQRELKCTAELAAERAVEIVRLGGVLTGEQHRVQELEEEVAEAHSLAPPSMLWDLRRAWETLQNDRRNADNRLLESEAQVQQLRFEMEHCSTSLEQAANQVNEEWLRCEEMQAQMKSLEAQAEVTALKVELQQQRSESNSELRASKELMALSQTRAVEEEKLAATRAEMQALRAEMRQDVRAETQALADVKFGEHDRRAYKHGSNRGEDCAGIDEVNLSDYEEQPTVFPVLDPPSIAHGVRLVVDNMPHLPAARSEQNFPVCTQAATSHPPPTPPEMHRDFFSGATGRVPHNAAVGRDDIALPQAAVGAGIAVGPGLGFGVGVGNGAGLALERGAGPLASPRSPFSETGFTKPSKGGRLPKGAGGSAGLVELLKQQHTSARELLDQKAAGESQAQSPSSLAPSEDQTITPSPSRRAFDFGNDGDAAVAPGHAFHSQAPFAAAAPPSIQQPVSENTDRRGPAPMRSLLSQYSFGRGGDALDDVCDLVAASTAPASDPVANCIEVTQALMDSQARAARLSQLNLSTLTNHARALGIMDGRIENALANENAKETLVKLILDDGGEY